MATKRRLREGLDPAGGEIRDLSTARAYEMMVMAPVRDLVATGAVLEPNRTDDLRGREAIEISIDGREIRPFLPEPVVHFRRAQGGPGFHEEVQDPESSGSRTEPMAVQEGP